MNSELVHSCSLRIGNRDVVDSLRVLQFELADHEQGHVLIGFSGGLDTVILKRVFSRIINYSTYIADPALRCVSSACLVEFKGIFEVIDIPGQVGRLWVGVEGEHEESRLTGL